jgi:hypothetical protein
VTETTEKKRPVGRPTDYNLDVAAAICDRIALGEQVVKICADPDMPGRTTVYQWLGTNEEFAIMYTRAREQRAELYAEEIVDIADNDRDYNKARVRIDARKWAAAKLNQKVYGDKITVDGTVKGGVDDKQLESRLAVLLRKAGVNSSTGGEGTQEGSPEAV